MKVVIATLSLLVILALSGSVIAVLAGVAGYLPDMSAKPPQAASETKTSRLR